LLAGFPPRLALWLGRGHDSPAFLIWFLISLLGLMVGAIRQISALVRSKEESPWASQETLLQRALFGLGVGSLVILGVFPQALAFLTDNLPLMFLHLSR